MIVFCLPCYQSVYLKSFYLKSVYLKPVYLKSVDLKPVYLKSVYLKPVYLNSVCLKLVNLKSFYLKACLPEICLPGSETISLPPLSVQVIIQQEWRRTVACSTHH